MIVDFVYYLLNWKFCGANFISEKDLNLICLLVLLSSLKLLYHLLTDRTRSKTMFSVET